MEYWMDALFTFLKERWIVIIIAVVALVLIIKIVQTVFKWLIVAAIIAALVYYGLQYSEDLREVSLMIKDYTMNEWNELMEKETESAQYTQNPDGSFVIKSKNITLEGREDSDTVVITFKGKSFNLTKNEMINSYIEHAKRNVNLSFRQSLEQLRVLLLYEWKEGQYERSA